MSAPLTQWHAAFVLHHHPYRDTSLLLEMLTVDAGRLGMVARGARRPKSHRRVLLQPLQPLLIRWSGRGELKTLIDVEPSARAFALSGQSLYAGFYINELVLRLTAREDPHPQLFEHYRQSLAGLGQANDGETLRRFEDALLRTIGYGVDWAHEADTGADIEAGARYRLSPDHGPIRANEQDDEGVSGASLLALDAGRIRDPRHLRETRRLLRAALARHLGGRPLQTPRLARQMRRGAQPADTVQ